MDILAEKIIMLCSPVRNGATVAIVKVVISCLKKDNEIEEFCNRM